MPNLIINIVGDARSFERALRKTERETRTFGSRMSRGLKVAGAVAGTALAGGLVAGLRSSIKAAMEAQKVLGQTRVAVRNAGQSWASYQGQIERSTKALSNLAAVDDEELLQSFSALVRATGDVNQALHLNEVAADLARGRNMDLASAAQLLVKVQAGQFGAARRLGIMIDKNASSTQALQQIQQRYAGSAAAYGRSAAGAQERFTVALENMEEAIGKALLPTITTYLNKASLWLNNSKNQKKASEDLTTAINGLAAALGGLANVLGTVKSAWDALPDFGKKKGLLDLLPGGNVSLLDLLGVTGGGGGGGRARAPTGPRGAMLPRAPLGPRGALRGAVGSAAAAAVPRGITAGQRNAWFDALIGRQLGRVQDVTSLRGQIGRLREIANLVRDRLAITKDVTRRLTLEDQLLDIQRDIRDRQAQIRDEQQRRQDEAKRLQQEATRAATRRFWEQKRLAQQQAQAKIERRTGWLQFAIERAEATKTLKDDVPAWRRYENFLKGLIRREGRTLDLTREVWRARQKIIDLNKQKGDEIRATPFQVRSPAKLAGMLGLGGDRYAMALLAQYGAGGRMPTRGAQFAGGTYVANQHFYGITDVNQFENAMTKNNRGKAHNRRGAR